MNWEPTLGAIHLENQHCRFRVWAPKARRVEVNLCGSRLVSLHGAVKTPWGLALNFDGPESDAAVQVDGEVLVVRRGDGAVLAFNFGREERAMDLPGKKILDSADERWGGPGSGERLAPRSVALYVDPTFLRVGFRRLGRVS